MDVHTLTKLALGIVWFAVLPWLAAAMYERRTRAFWSTAAAPLRINAGSYRSAQVAPGDAPGRAPWVVRAAAVACFAAFQTLLPGAYLAWLLLTRYFLGVVLLPWLFVAWQFGALGFLLLRRDVGAVLLARSVAARAGALNAVVLGLAALAALPAWSLGVSWSRWPLAPLAGVMAYAVLSLAHAKLIARAATAIERLDDADTAARAAPHALGAALGTRA